MRNVKEVICSAFDFEAMFKQIKTNDESKK